MAAAAICDGLVMATEICDAAPLAMAGRMKMATPGLPLASEPALFCYLRRAEIVRQRVERGLHLGNVLVAHGEQPADLGLLRR